MKKLKKVLFLSFSIFININVGLTLTCAVWDTIVGENFSDVKNR